MRLRKQNVPPVTAASSVLYLRRCVQTIVRIDGFAENEELKRRWVENSNCTIPLFIQRSNTQNVQGQTMTEHATAVLDNYAQHFAANEIAIAVKHAMILVGVTKNVCF